MPTATIIVDAILFDMDGPSLALTNHLTGSPFAYRTLIDSTPGVFKAWKIFSDDYNLGDSEAIVHATHGRRLYDTLKEYCNIADNDKLQTEIDRFEDGVIEGGPTALPGAIDLISSLNNHPESARRWTIVTSATNKYSPRALERAGMALPLLGIITSNDVSHGKPHPAPYLAGAAKCSADPENCLVVEDAISGLRAGRAAGATTLAVLTSTERNIIMQSDALPNYIVQDLTKVEVDVVSGKLQVTMDLS
ncbi:hypothetical protein D9619_003085 [Psilocybe cf. subviscida]|uniref:HAD-like protein n=1 Tax=Psilocybe cf. subviscida TaxID=2480587 RepID=A0A8H5AVY1_9AGAR|nr:hypothetical protein D9619_003085 [Psilocybe cf. subviscida]